MSSFLRVLLLSVFSATLIIACSSTEMTTGEETTSNSIYPQWYTPSGFEADSLSFHGFATAISSDSTIAIANAELQARINLESAMAKKMEEVREALEEEGNSLATNTDFIITLRNAQDAVEDAATEEEGEARPTENYYTGFAKVSISKNNFKELMESGLRAKTGYWNTLSSSAVFIEEVN